MKGRVVLLDMVGDRQAAALMLDGKLIDLLIDPPEAAAPAPGTIFRAVADRPMKGQGGITLTLDAGAKGFLRQAKGISPGDRLLVQVSGVAEPHKAVPVTERLLFKSRYAIVTPGAPGLNVSRQIKDEAERDRLLELAHAVMEHMDPGLGLILRSACEGVDEDTIAADITAMKDLAGMVFGENGNDPECLLDAPTSHDLAWREWAMPDPDEVIEAPGCFADNGVLDAVDALLGPQADLPGGAHAMIEETSALIAVDVNTGSDTSLAAGLKANMALARDLPRQLRLRGLAGQIVLDVAPMPKKDRRAFEDALRRAFRADATDTVLAGWTPLGHFELQRKRDRWPLKKVWPK